MTPRKEEFLKTLPPELAAKMRIDEADAKNVAALKVFGDMIEVAGDTALHLAVIAYCEAKSDEEREEVIRAVVVTTVTLHTMRVVFEHAVPPKPRTGIIEVFVKAANGEMQRYDRIMREALPEGAKKRIEHLAEIAKQKSEATGG